MPTKTLEQKARERPTDQAIAMLAVEITTLQTALSSTMDGFDKLMERHENLAGRVVDMEESLERLT